MELQNEKEVLWLSLYLCFHMESLFAFLFSGVDVSPARTKVFVTVFCISVHVFHRWKVNNRWLLKWPTQDLHVWFIGPYMIPIMEVKVKATERDILTVHC